MADPIPLGEREDITSPAPAKARPRLGRVVALVAVVVLAPVFAAVATVLLVVSHYSEGLPSVEQLKSGYDPPQLTRILARDGAVLADVFTERRTLVPFSEVPDNAKLSFLAAEDASFYEHQGLNYFGMLRALAANLRAGATRQGGSTITQQVVKNVLLDPERTMKRKIRETILARRLEQSLTKDEILNLYLNHIYLGHGRYGIEEASRYYFGKKARALELPESALLAGLVAAPERFSPRKNPERALERRRYVLGQMLAKGFITRELYDDVKDVPLKLAPASDAESEVSPEAVDAAKRMLDAVAGPSAQHGGYEITTTISPTLETAARRAVRENLDAYAARHGIRPPFTQTARKEWGKPFVGAPAVHRVYVGTVEGTDDRLGTIDVRLGDVVGRVFLAQESRYNPGGLPPSRFAERGAVLRASIVAPWEPGEKPALRLELGPESALVALDVRTREVLALVGSYEATPGGLDRAMQAKRQPGSAFKPFVYSYALHARQVTPATMLTVPASPHDPRDTTTKKESVRDAIAKSDNAAAIALLRGAGAAAVAEWAHAVGIESHLGADESLALGSYEVTPLEIAGAFATFASGGEVAAPVLIKSITKAGGHVIELPPKPPARRAMDADEAYLVTSLLKSVVGYGTARRAQSLGRPVAGKTGTTNASKDAWFVGYSTDIVAAVWVGYDDALPLGSSESGAVTALPAWITFMKAAHEGRPVTEFSRPSTVVTARVDPSTGLLARDEDGAVEEEFLEGTAPTEMTPPPDAGIAHAPAPQAVSANRRDAGVALDEPPPF
ncbi:MAG TPA: PBP1A family penicillin-binding protein [Polyangiaceae bacterium]|nr:PBP1A family penicillin-binding protein [Polyangiaceae bacterium]